MKQMVRVLLFWLLCASPFLAQATKQREELEQYDLSSLTYLTFDETKCGPVAGLIDRKGFAHQLKEGGFIGKHFGRVESITEERIDIVELYKDKDGTWYEKRATIERLR